MALPILKLKNAFLNWSMFGFVFILELVSIWLFLFSNPHDIPTKILSLTAISAGVIYVRKFEGERLKTLATILPNISRLIKGVSWSSVLPYIFLTGLILVVYTNYPSLPLANILTSAQGYLVAITLATGFGSFWLNRERITHDVEAESAQEELDEQERREEFSQKFPRLNKIPIVKNLAQWMYKEGWWYGAVVILIFLTGLILHILIADWSKGYTYFHSGESQFYKLIKLFSSGYIEAIYQRTQSIVIYTFGTIDHLFNGTMSIFSLRLTISLTTFFINFYILANLKNIKFLKLSKLATVYILTGFTLSYAVLFYSSVIRSDIFILTFFNLFLYEYLKNGVKKIYYLMILSTLAVSFKGNGVLLPLILISVINLELIIETCRNRRWDISRFLFNNFFTITLLYLLFLSLNPLFLKEGIFNFLEVLKTGMGKLGSGHYGLFATGQSLVKIYSNRIFNFLIFFSPLIVFYFLGIYFYFYKKLKKFNLKNVLFSQEIRVAVILLLSLVFFIFIFTKPIQFYRYYFHFLTVFFVVTFTTIAKIRLRMFSVSLMICYIAFNSYFIYFLINNTRLNIDLSSYKSLYKEDNTHYWMIPPSATFAGEISSVDELPPDGYLLITEQDKYIYNNILYNPEKYNSKDFAETDPNTIKKRTAFYEQLAKLNQVKSTGENKFWGIYLPYDVWYMNSPNYYLYQKK